jgi:hypothetical protein
VVGQAGGNETADLAEGGQILTIEFPLPGLGYLGRPRGRADLTFTKISAGEGWRLIEGYKDVSGPRR